MTAFGAAATPATDGPRPERVALLSGDYRLRTLSLLTFADFGAEPRVPNVRFAPLATNGGGAQPLSVRKRYSGRPSRRNASPIGSQISARPV